MPSARTQIRTAIIAALSDNTTGLNARAAALASEYGVSWTYIDWSADSPNFIQSYIVELDLANRSPLIDFPAVAVYTSQAINQNRLKFSVFSGVIVGHVQIYLAYRSSLASTFGLLEKNTELHADVAEEAALKALDALSGRTIALLPTNRSYNGKLQVERSPIIQYGDGVAQLISIAIEFLIND